MKQMKTLACTLILSLLFAFSFGQNSFDIAYAASTSSTIKPDVDKGNSTLTAYAKEVLRLVNVERMKAGLKPYTSSSALTKAAKV